MDVNVKLLKFVSLICGTLLIIGTAVFFYNYFVSGSSNATGIGYGIVMGATFVFIMGIFLVATEESIKGRKKQDEQLER